MHAHAACGNFDPQNMGIFTQNTPSSNYSQYLIPNKYFLYTNRIKYTQVHNKTFKICNFCFLLGNNVVFQEFPTQKVSEYMKHFKFSKRKCVYFGV